MFNSVSVDGDHVVIKIHKESVHALRVALKPVRVGEVTSASTQKIRDDLKNALSRVEAHR